MAATTEISWTDATFNGWIGCSKVHAGCTHCYAESFANRYGKAKWGPAGTRAKTSDANWKLPLKWNKEAQAEGVRKRVFCSSLADVFEDWEDFVLDHKGNVILQCDSCANPDDTLHRDTVAVFERAEKYYEHGCGEHMRHLTLSDLRRDLFALIDKTPWLDWQLLTKRPENVLRMWPGGFRPNVWLGTSVSDQATADEWVPRLLACKGLCPVLFLSAEPLIGPVDLAQSVMLRKIGDGQPGWVIVGGESGHGARPFDVAWARDLVQQCKAAGVPCFVKQLGAVVRDSDTSEWPNPDRLLSPSSSLGWGDNGVRRYFKDKAAADMAAWHPDLCVRQFPEPTYGR